MEERVEDWPALATLTGLQVKIIKKILEVFRRNHLVFLEINPYVVQKNGVCFIDMAVEVDDAAIHFAEDWGKEDLIQPPGLAPEEQRVKALGEKSAASFSLSVLNPDGGLFLLLSGGGASVVVADEAYNQHSKDMLANYGEYSGNPTTEETYLYTSQLLSLLLASRAKKKVLFVGGAVANFTDVVDTFRGIVQALEERAIDLRRHKVKVYVRRGGPRQEEGLKMIKRCLEKHDLLGAVHGPELNLAEATIEAITSLR